jgi:hypothetical protein
LLIFFPLSGDFAGGMDGHNVLCTRRAQFLGLDLLCFTHCGKHYFQILFQFQHILFQIEYIIYKINIVPLVKLPLVQNYAKLEL